MAPMVGNYLEFRQASRGHTWQKRGPRLQLFIFTSAASTFASRARRGGAVQMGQHSGNLTMRKGGLVYKMCGFNLA